MSKVIKLTVRPQCDVCRSKNIIAVLSIIHDDKETVKHFCELHAKAKLEAGLVDSLTI